MAVCFPDQSVCVPTCVYLHEHMCMLMSEELHLQALILSACIRTLVTLTTHHVCQCSSDLIDSGSNYYTVTQ